MEQITTEQLLEIIGELHVQNRVLQKIIQNLSQTHIANDNTQKVHEPFTTHVN
jgi:hypothetical protein